MMPQRIAAATISGLRRRMQAGSVGFAYFNVSGTGVENEGYW